VLDILGQIVIGGANEPLIRADFCAQISADQRNVVSVNQRFILPARPLHLLRKVAKFIKPCE
jgi:hypothetical protein